MQPRLIPSPIRFPPAQLKARHDGWTPERQIRFIAEPAATRSITRACKAVGKSREAAYTLRARPEAAAGFAIAWRLALEPDFTAERRHSPRAVQRLRKLAALRLLREAMAPARPDLNSACAEPVEASKVDEANETHTTPDSLFFGPANRQHCRL